MKRLFGCWLVLLSLVVFVSGCQGSSAPSELTIEITVADGEIQPNGEMFKVAKGGTVKLIMNADTEDHVHVHGYELEYDLVPGEEKTDSFSADLVGVYEIESHTTGKIYCKLAVS